MFAASGCYVIIPKYNQYNKKENLSEFNIVTILILLYFDEESKQSHSRTAPTSNTQQRFILNDSLYSSLNESAV